MFWWNTTVYYEELRKWEHSTLNIETLDLTKKCTLMIKYFRQSFCRQKLFQEDGKNILAKVLIVDMRLLDYYIMIGINS